MKIEKKWAVHETISDTYYAGKPAWCAATTARRSPMRAATKKSAIPRGNRNGAQVKNGVAINCTFIISRSRKKVNTKLP